MPKHSLEPSQQRQLENWIDEVRQHEDSALKWAVALYKIKRSGFWEADFDTWPEFCEEAFGYKKSMAYRYVACGEAMEENKEEFQENPPTSIRQVEQRAKVHRGGIQNCEYVGTEPELKESKAMARTIPNEEVEYAARVTPPVDAIQAHPPRPIVPVPVWNEIHAILNYVNRLQQNAAFAGPEIRKLAEMLKVLREHIQMPLGNILEQVPSEPKKAKGTFDEVRAYMLESQGPSMPALPESDAVYIFNKWDSTGWKNGGEKIRDWQATVRSWKAAGYFPSQKPVRGQFGNGAPAAAKPAYSPDKELASLKRRGLID